MMETEPALDEIEVPWLWEGVERGLLRPERVGFALGALAQTLGSLPNGDDEDRFLVRALVSLDGPRGDRVWVDVERQGRPMSLRAFVTELRRRGYDFERQGLAPWCAALRHDFAHAFDVAPAEFYERCMPHYHGFLHAWTDEHSARAYFKSWPLERQASFQHEYLLYAANDANFAAKHGGAAHRGLQEAAAWLQGRRRYLFRWTFVVRETPRALPEWLGDFEGTLIRAWEEFRAAVQQTPDAQWLLPQLEASSAQLFSPADLQYPLLETLRRLGADARRQRRAGVFEVLQRLVDSLDTFDPPAGTALQALRVRLKEACRSAW